MELRSGSIKIESAEDDPSMQSYLDAFKEIENGGNTATIISELESADIMEAENGTYFVDENGCYYYQPTPVPTIIDTCAGSDLNREASGDLMIPGGEAYQTVTVVPSESAGGEFSYLIIVQAPEDVDSKVRAQVEEKRDKDTDVYDFHESEAEVPGEGSSAEDDKSQILKIPLKKSLVVTHSCAYCEYSNAKRYLLGRHLKTHSDYRPYECAACGRAFKTTASLQNHVNTHTGVKPHACKHCSSTFTTSGELVRHVRYRHTHEKPHRCAECDYASVELSKLKRHVRAHTGERPYQCKQCTYASPDTSKLKRHLRTHTGERPYACNICGMMFTQSNSLKAHGLLHNLAARTLYRCELCPTTCGRKTDLRIHVQNLHTSDRPYPCKLCGALLPDRYSYKMHVRTHSGEKRYKCELCPYASASRLHLGSHALTHTKEKPFICAICNQTFRQKQLLRRHENLHHNPDYVPARPRERSHACAECGRRYAHRGNLARHAARHEPGSGVRGTERDGHVGGQPQPGSGAETPVEKSPGVEESYIVVKIVETPDQRAVETCDSSEPDFGVTDAVAHEYCAPSDIEMKEDIKTCFGFDEEDSEE